MKIKDSTTTLCKWTLAGLAWGVAIKADPLFDRVPQTNQAFLIGVMIGIVWSAVALLGWSWNLVKEQAAETGQPKPRLRDLFFPPKVKGGE